MERRASERLPVNLRARMFYGNMVYTGIVTNLSENGMFISTRMSFPVDSILIAVVLVEGHSLKLPIKIRRTVKPDNLRGVEDSGMGVMLLNPSKEYIDFVSKCKSSPDISNN